MKFLRKASRLFLTQNAESHLATKQKAIELALDNMTGSWSDVTIPKLREEITDALEKSFNQLSANHKIQQELGSLEKQINNYVKQGSKMSAETQGRAKQTIIEIVKAFGRDSVDNPFFINEDILGRMLRAAEKEGSKYTDNLKLVVKNYREKILQFNKAIANGDYQSAFTLLAYGDDITKNMGSTNESIIGLIESIHNFNDGQYFARDVEVEQYLRRYYLGDETIEVESDAKNLIKKHLEKQYY